MSAIHLICNAHLDPVWLWEWPEGAAEALATFRTAVGLCETCGELVFNHNEALLYSWIEEYEPQLFSRIAVLVRAGRWRVMGGWFLQPDCTMPCGESFMRQILWGRRYFREKFGVRPTTAANLDSFGHSQGLVQILRQAGYDSYLFCRPRLEQLPLPGGCFRWVGLDGSQVLAQRVEGQYNSRLGQAANKVRKWLEQHPGASALPAGGQAGGRSRTASWRCASTRTPGWWPATASGVCLCCATGPSGRWSCKMTPTPGACACAGSVGRPGSSG